MGLLDKFKKGGGGFLNNVDGVIEDYEFSTEFPGTTKKAKTSDFVSLFFTITIRQDGAEEPVTTTLNAGGGADFVISDDGKTLTPVDGAGLWGGTAFARFYGSLVSNGLVDIEVEDGEPLDFSHILGVRAHFVQVVDTEAMTRAAKTWKKSNGKINEKGQRKGSDGKFYDQRSLEVSQVYETEPAKSRPSASKPASRASAAPAKKVKGGDALGTFAQETLVEILNEAKGKSLAKGKLNLAITRKLNGDDRRDDVRKWIYDDTNLEALDEAGVITFDKAGRDQIVALVE